VAGAAWTELWRRIVCRCRGEGAAAGSTRRDFRLLVFAKTRICFCCAELCATRGQARILAFVEVRTRTAREDQAALPEQTVTAEKQHLVGRTARRFLMERHAKECPLQFDVVAIEEFPGQLPVVWLHKSAFWLRMYSSSLENPQRISRTR
jgi:Holliday junction resolvase-like predicted endonuclease